MCNFLSAVYTKTGKLICEPIATDSHSDLIEAYNLHERQTNAPVQNFVRLELTPPESGFSTDFDDWKEVIDEHELPGWFENAQRFDAFEGMRDVLRAAVVGDGTYLNRFLIVEDAKLVKAKWCRVIVFGSSQVKAYDSSQVKAYDSSQVKAYDSSQVTAYNSSQVAAYNFSQVKAYNFSQVKAYNSSQVKAYNSSQVAASYASQVKAYDSSQVKAYDSSKVTAYHSSQVEALDSSKVTAYHSSQVTAYGSSEVTDRRPKPEPITN